MRPRSPQPFILMYHRVVDAPCDPWGLCVRPERFEEHLAVLGRSRQPMPLSDFVERLEEGTLPRDAVAVTFDDGYADNLRNAKPRLAAAGVPATLFLAAGTLGQRTGYWWDELARGILMNESGADIEVEIGGERRRVTFAPAESGAACRPAWRAWEEPGTDREAAYLSLWGRLRTVTPAERERAMIRLRRALSPAPPDALDLPMTAEDIAELTADGLVEIGGHTVTHPVLPALDRAGQHWEILDGKRACERIVATTIEGFAYPHGAHDAVSRAAVQECGFKWACSTESRPVPPRGYDRYALPRVAVLDGDGDAFARQLQTVTA